MPAFTCKQMLIDEAPKKIQILGDKTKKTEPAQHIIEFPGGAIELSRTSQGNYWAHIIINTQETINDSKGLFSAKGKIIESRIDSREGVTKINDYEKISQIAVLIQPL